MSPHTNNKTASKLRNIALSKLNNPANCRQAYNNLTAAERKKVDVIMRHEIKKTSQLFATQASDIE